MAVYTDHQIGHRSESNSVAPVTVNVWGIATLVFVMAVMAWFAYGALTLPPVDTKTIPQPNITQSAPAYQSVMPSTP